MHRVTISDEETTSKEKDEDKKIREERPPIQSSDYGAVTHTIFSPEKIQDLVPLGGNGALILGLRKFLGVLIPVETSFAENKTAKLEMFLTLLAGSLYAYAIS